MSRLVSFSAVCHIGQAYNKPQFCSRCHHARRCQSSSLHDALEPRTYQRQRVLYHGRASAGPRSGQRDVFSEPGQSNPGEKERDRDGDRAVLVA